MKAEEMKLPNPKAADVQAIAMDFSYETDPPEIQAIIPRDRWVKFIQETYRFQAAQSSLFSQMLQAKAEMFKNKSALLK